MKALGRASSEHAFLDVVNIEEEFHFAGRLAELRDLGGEVFLRSLGQIAEAQSGQCGSQWSINRALRVHIHDLAGFERRKRGEHFRHQWERMMELRAGGVQDNDGDVELGHGLLETQVAVAGDEHVELFLGQRQ